jgi:hypothetical protein
MMTPTHRALGVAASLLWSACAPAGETIARAPSRRPELATQIAATLAAPAQTPDEPLGTSRLVWWWSSEAVGTISEVAPTADGGAVVLLRERSDDGLPLHLGWLSSAGDLVAQRSLASGSPDSIRLAEPGLVVTPDALAVLAFSITCSPGRCPELGRSAIETGAHLAIFSPGGMAWHVGLGEGEVESVAVNGSGQVAVALARRSGSSIHVLDRARGVVVDAPHPPLGAPMRLAFLEDGTLLIGEGSRLTRLGADGRVVWQVDLGGDFSVEHLVAAGDRVALSGTLAGQAVLGVLDGTGSLRWARHVADPRGRVDAIAVDRTGAVAAVSGSVFVRKYDAQGALDWEYFTAMQPVIPAGMAHSVAFVQGVVVYGGTPAGGSWGTLTAFADGVLTP